MHGRISGLLFCICGLIGTACGQTVTGSGTSGTVPVFTGSSTVANSPISVSGSNVGIGTAAPGAKLDVSDNVDMHSGIQKWGAYTIGAASSPLYEVLGVQGVPQAGSNPSMAASGFGFVSGPNQASPVVWMYAFGGQNAFRVISKGYGTSIRVISKGYGTSIGSDPVLFDVDVSGNVGIGTTSPGAALEVNGNLKLTAGSGASIAFPDGTVQSTAYTGVICGGDYAESVDVYGDRKHYEPGDVLVLTSDGNGDVAESAEPYSTLVAGIYSTKPGTVGRRQTTVAKTATDEIPMAMIGIVPTKVSAENGPVHRGDLLVTSSAQGVAMKGTDRSRMLGAVIGKAMGSLDSGTGVIEVLVTLQ